MLTLTINYEDGQVISQAYDVPLEIGRDSASGLCIRAWRVARRHARITTRSGGLFLEDHGSLLGTALNGRRVLQHSPLKPGDELVIGPCLIKVAGFSAAKPSGSESQDSHPVSFEMQPGN